MINTTNIDFFQHCRLFETIDKVRNSQNPNSLDNALADIRTFFLRITLTRPRDTKEIGRKALEFYELVYAHWPVCQRLSELAEFEASGCPPAPLAPLESSEAYEDKLSAFVSSLVEGFLDAREEGALTAEGILLLHEDFKVCCLGFLAAVFQVLDNFLPPADSVASGITSHFRAFLSRISPLVLPEFFASPKCPKFWQIYTQMEPDPLKSEFYNANFQAPLVSHIERQCLIRLLWWEPLSPPQYASEAESFLEALAATAELYYPQSKSAIAACAEKLLVLQRAERLCSDHSAGVRALLDSRDFPALHKVHKLLSRQPQAIAPLAAQLHDAVYSEAAAIPADDKEFIQKLTKIRNNYNTIAAETLCSDPQTRTAVDTAIKKAMHDNPHTQLLLAIQYDAALEKVNPTEDLFQLFRLLFQKDEFLKHHQNLLCRRLLRSSTDLHSERELALKLRSETSFSITNPIFHMINDFSNEENAVSLPDSPIRIQVLTRSAWPLKIDAVPPRIPAQLQAEYAKLLRVYADRFPSRTINLSSRHGTAELLFFCKSAKYALKLNTAQLFALLHIASGDSPNPHEHDQAALAPLVAHQILTPDYKINPDFVAKKTRLNLIPRANGAQQMQPSAQVEKEIAQERNHAVDALIIRVLKNRKITHTALVEAMFKLSVDFQPSQTLIKQRIQALAEREYLQIVPTENSETTYIYLP